MLRDSYEQIDLGTGLLSVGLAEAASNLAGDSLIDRAGKVAVATTPLPVVEQTIRFLGTTDKPFLRANLITLGALIAGRAVPGRRPAAAQLALGALGLAAVMAGRRHLDAAEAAVPESFDLGVVDSPPLPTDGAEEWPGVEPLITDPDRFYVTDINLRPPVVELSDWRLQIHSGDTRRELGMDELIGLGPRERDAALVCVHNRPGWDRLGQQRWTGVPLEEVLEAAGAMPADPAATEMVMEAEDGYTQVMRLGEAIERRAWVVFGMGGAPLPRAQGYPARIMMPGVVGQYNGVKWLRSIRLDPAGTNDAWWVKRGWPRETVEVPPMARIDNPSNTGMPPRLPPKPIEVSAGPIEIVGTAWAPPHGVEGVEVRIDGGDWTEAELAGEVNPDSWRRWRLGADLEPGEHLLEARCRSRNGSVQAGEPVEPFPYGSGAYHQVELTAA